jgi:hypothetical protein
MLQHERPLGLQVLVEPHALRHASQQLRQRRLAPFERLAPQIIAASSIKSKSYMNTLPSWRRYLIRSNSAMPSSPQATASPSMTRDRERKGTARIKAGQVLVRAP